MQALRADEEGSTAVEVVTGATTAAPVSTSWEAVKQTAPEFLAESAPAETAADSASAAAAEVVKAPTKVRGSDEGHGPPYMA